MRWWTDRKHEPQSGGAPESVRAAVAEAVTLSLRARLTLWYGVVQLAVLLIGGVAVVWLHQRLTLARVDAKLRDDAATVAALVRAELDEAGPESADGEETNPAESAREALVDLELPGAGVAVVSGTGAVLASRAFGVRALAAAELTEAATSRTGGMSRGSLRVHHEAQRARTRRFGIVTWSSLDDYRREHATLLQALWFGVPLALLVASVGGWIVGHRGLHPLSEMARQAEAITADQPDARLQQPMRRDELGALASSFNALLDRLGSALRVQRQFMADASHQLRTPVSIARTASQVTLSMPNRTPEEYREALEVVANQTRRLSEMIDRMFTLALADLRARPLQLNDFYLDELVQESARAAEVLAAGRQVTIRIDAPTEVPFRGDETLLRQMIMNLAENAIRHTPPHGTVDLRLTTSEREGRLEVWDTGCGIPPEDRARIFDRFVRLENAESAGGAGLGLPIARWVAEAHHGTLELERSGSGGSCFVAVLPRGNRADERPSTASFT
jgi:signal transduction histidine kinase